MPSSPSSPPFINALTSPCRSLQNTQIFELCHRFIMARRGLGTWLLTTVASLAPRPFLYATQPVGRIQGMKRDDHDTISTHMAIANDMCSCFMHKVSSYADTELSCKVQLPCCNHFCSISTHYKKQHQVHCCDHRYHAIKRTSTVYYTSLCSDLSTDLIV